MRNQTDKSGFVQAVENDEYAEFVLAPGLFLITDWEGDGTFLPYVVDMNDRTKREVDDLLADNAPFLRCDGVEYDRGNDTYYPFAAEIVD